MTVTVLPAQAAFELPLWPEGAPTTLADARTERWFTTPPEAAFAFRQVRNVTQPTLTGFLPDARVATGTAVVVLPGGGLHTLAVEHEGYDVARWLAGRGVAAFVLKYRTIVTSDLDDEYETLFRERLKDEAGMRAVTHAHEPHVLADAQRALDLVREHVREWRVTPGRVGLLGFSAGGFVTVRVTLRGGGPRPDFIAPIYGAMWDDVTAPPDAPPLFLAYADDDDLAERVVGPNLALYEAWRREGRSVELHVYARGGHGFGMRRQDLPSDHWIDRFHEWLRAQNLLGTPVP
ncbi:alpha/beta hydrolase [Deinococcus pimensis]|uniref:alpha/beta hydrolase n=1 Tax=Deinococcus pimensis TaxID=309888 RepID=UPI0004B9A376|nr:alpha/beta hydrolase [Deinococcus pimensis]